MPGAANSQDRIRANLQREVDGAAVYQAMAAAESDPNLADVYRRLAEVESSHADIWRTKLGGAGGPVKPSLKVRVLIGLAGRVGPGAILPALLADERRDRGLYANQADARAAGLPQAEALHGKVLGAALAAPRGLAGGSLAKLEGRHSAAGGNALRAAVLGANDGLVSNLSLVMGMAGAAAGSRIVLLTGVAGLVAGACSMAMGEWLSVNSSRELYARQIEIEAEELAQSPEQEAEELALIYQTKGFDRAEAANLATRMLGQKDKALDTLVREELGLDPDQLGGSAWSAAATSFLLFAMGAIFPILPFLVSSGAMAVVASLALSAMVLALIGAGTSFFTGRSVAFSAGRQVAIGLAAAAITFGLGRLAGATLS
jgi:VIT1/CCC1 family predicted Fe2+/Mn2+ transporter